MKTIAEESLNEIKQAFQNNRDVFLCRWQLIEIEEYLENIGYSYGSHSYLESWLNAEKIKINIYEWEESKQAK